MKKVYIISGCYYSPNKVYASKEKAEKMAAIENYNLECSGSHQWVGVSEIEFDETEDTEEDK